MQLERHAAAGPDFSVGVYIFVGKNIDVKVSFGFLRNIKQTHVANIITKQAPHGNDSREKIKSGLNHIIIF